METFPRYWPFVRGIRLDISGFTLSVTGVRIEWTPVCKQDSVVTTAVPLQWRHNQRDGVSNHRRLGCLFNLCSCADERKHQSSLSLAFFREIQWSPVDSPHRGPVKGKMFPFDDVIMPADAYGQWGSEWVRVSEWVSEWMGEWTNWLVDQLLIELIDLLIHGLIDCLSVEAAQITYQLPLFIFDNMYVCVYTWPNFLEVSVGNHVVRFKLSSWCPSLSVPCYLLPWMWLAPSRHSHAHH